MSTVTLLTNSRAVPPSFHNGRGPEEKAWSRLRWLAEPFMDTRHGPSWFTSCCYPIRLNRPNQKHLDPQMAAQFPCQAVKPVKFTTCFVYNNDSDQIKQKCKESRYGWNWKNIYNVIDWWQAAGKWWWWGGGININSTGNVVTRIDRVHLTLPSLALIEFIRHFLSEFQTGGKKHSLD